MPSPSAARVLSGHRPTGTLHLGHLVGALSNWIELQKEFDCFYAVVDWHALTTDYKDPSRIQEFIRETIVDWVAAGLDPDKCTLFVQSHVKEHAEMHVLLSMIVPLPWLERVPTYKEQRQQLADRELNNYGFLGYPVLQAADIALYEARFVPVGEDQLPHLELAREIVRRFNNLYGEVLVEPEAKTTILPKLPGTDGRKMSKSYDNAIGLSEDEETIRGKYRTMMTDPARQRRRDPGNPDICPVFQHHRAFTPADRRAEIDRDCRTAAIGCVDCKADVAGRVIKRFDPFRQKKAELLRDPERVDEILKQGAAKARSVAAKTMVQVRKAMGLSDEP